MGTSVSVCIPTFDKPLWMVQRAVDSAVAQADALTEIIIAPQGERARKYVRDLCLPQQAKVLSPDQPGGLVANWNRCLVESKGSLVHILHDDDVIVPGFYEAILSMAERYPNAALYATGYGSHGDPRSGRGWDDSDRPIHLVGPRSATFLLYSGVHCGSVVLPRRTIDRLGLFEEAFPYCPDEEAYLRYSAKGGVAFYPGRLYEARTSVFQARRATWREPDFATVYMSARVRGAAYFGPMLTRLAEESSARRIISVAITLASEGVPSIGAAHLRELAEMYPECSSWWRYRLASAAMSHPSLLGLVPLRLRVLKALGRRSG